MKEKDIIIRCRRDYSDYITRDGKNYKIVSGNAGVKERILNRLLSTPISDQSKIWSYIKTLRKCEYWHNTGTLLGGVSLSICGTCIN